MISCHRLVSKNCSRALWQAVFIHAREVWGFRTCTITAFLRHGCGRGLNERRPQLLGISRRHINRVASVSDYRSPGAVCWIVKATGSLIIVRVRDAHDVLGYRAVLQVVIVSSLRQRNLWFRREPFGQQGFSERLLRVVVKLNAVVGFLVLLVF
jgi:hypothetical protein